MLEKRVNWMGIAGAAVLLGYGWWREPLAAVLGGMILFVDFLMAVKNNFHFFEPFF